MKRCAFGFLCFALLLIGATTAHAGAKLKINDDAEIDLAFRLQVLSIFSERDVDGGGDYESYDDFRIRRARFRLTGTVNKHFGMFFQTDVSGNDIIMIDAYIHLKKDDGLQAFVGQHLAPSSRQSITSSGALMAMDRPGLTYKALTWGGRALTTFDTVTYGDGNAGFSGPAQVRDTGITVFGHQDASDKLHYKYYLGVYDGLSAPGKDSERYTGRFQLNFGDSESSFYSTSTYLGGKDTLSFGVSYDTQSDVSGASTPTTDYSYLTLDVFADKPLGDGAFTFEGSYHDLDLDGANARAEGDGFYAQLGYLLPGKKWQVWGLYETWSAEDPTGKGSYDMFRVGVSYFMAKHNANFKLGYEGFNADAPIGSSVEDSIGSLVLGFYTTY